MVKENASIEKRKIKGIMELLGTTILWGSSFPAIKVIVSNISSFAYVWLRSLIAALVMLPYIIFKILSDRNKDKILYSAKGGIITGLIFALGLWFQGYGTEYTTASNSAFITGINVIFVHIYSALIKRKYSSNLATSLILSIVGLYLLTSPEGGPNKGDLLVLIGSVFWAMQVIFVDIYSRSEPFIFTFFEMIPSMLFIFPSMMAGAFFPKINSEILLILLYLGVMCADVAFILQVLGQKHVEAAVAALIFLLEPVFASLFSMAFLGERLTLVEILGMAFILVGILLSQKEAVFGSHSL